MEQKIQKSQPFSPDNWLSNLKIVGFRPKISQKRVGARVSCPLVSALMPGRGSIMAPSPTPPLSIGVVIRCIGMTALAIYCASYMVYGVIETYRNW